MREFSTPASLYLKAVKQNIDYKAQERLPLPRQALSLMFSLFFKNLALGFSIR